MLIELAEDIKLHKDVDLDHIADISRGFTPADLMNAIKTAARYTIRKKQMEQDIIDKTNDDESIFAICQNDLVLALVTIKRNN